MLKISSSSPGMMVRLRGEEKLRLRFREAEGKCRGLTPLCVEAPLIGDS